MNENTYPGGKGAAGAAQQIINRIPKHDRYIEPFAGAATIFRKKRPAGSSILIELDRIQSSKLAMLAGRSCTVIQGDAVLELAKLLPTMSDRDFVYFDPPYVHAARKDLKLYRHEMTDEQHRHLVASLLPTLSAAGVRWMLSGYRNPIYDEASSLQTAWQHDFRAMTRRGPAIETIWMNYDPERSTIAESTFAGSDFRERQRIKRKAQRWAAKFHTLPKLEQQAILTMLDALPPCNK